MCKPGGVPFLFELVSLWHLVRSLPVLAVPEWLQWHPQAPRTRASAWSKARCPRCCVFMSGIPVFSSPSSGSGSKPLRVHLGAAPLDPARQVGSTGGQCVFTQCCALGQQRSRVLPQGSTAWHVSPSPPLPSALSSSSCRGMGFRVPEPKALSFAPPGPKYIPWDTSVKIQGLRVNHPAGLLAAAQWAAQPRQSEEEALVSSANSLFRLRCLSHFQWSWIYPSGASLQQHAGNPMWRRYFAVCWLNISSSSPPRQRFTFYMWPWRICCRLTVPHAVLGSSAPALLPEPLAAACACLWPQAAKRPSPWRCQASSC